MVTQMHPAYIQAELKIRGSSSSDVARQLGVSRQAVSLTINDPKSRSRRIEEAIADILGLPVKQVFTDRPHPPRKLAVKRSATPTNQEAA